METFINTEFLGDTVQLRITYHEEESNWYEPPYIVLDELHTFAVDENNNERTVDLTDMLMNPTIYKEVYGLMEEEKQGV